MASSSLNILSGIVAAAAGLAGEKVSKNGSIPGLDLAAIVPALLGKAGRAAGIAGALASVAAKSGLLNNSRLGNLADLAGSLLSSSGNTGAIKKNAEGIEGLAAAIAGNSGSGADLGAIASMAITLAKSVKNEKGLMDMASKLGKTLSGTFGVSFNGAGTALKALNNVLESDTKGELFKVILKNLA
jgi:hypothetical protein